MVLRMSIDTIVQHRPTQDLGERPQDHLKESAHNNPATAHNIGAVAAFSAHDTPPVIDEEGTVRMSPEDLFEDDTEYEAYEALSDAMQLLEKTKIGLVVSVSNHMYDGMVADFSNDVKKLAVGAVAESLPGEDLENLINRISGLDNQQGDPLLLEQLMAVDRDGKKGKEITPQKAMMLAMAWDLSGGDRSLGAAVEMAITKVYNNSEKYGDDGPNMVVAYNVSRGRHDAAEGLAGTSIAKGPLSMGNFAETFIKARKRSRNDHSNTPPSNEEVTTPDSTMHVRSVGKKAYSLMAANYAYTPSPSHDLHYLIGKHLQADDRTPLEKVGDSQDLYRQAHDASADERKYIAFLNLRDTTSMLLTVFDEKGRPDPTHVTLASMQRLVDSISIINQERPELLPETFIPALKAMMASYEDRLAIFNVQKASTSGSEDEKASPLAEIKRGLQTFEKNGRQGSLRGYVNEEVIKTQRRERIAAVSLEFETYKSALRQLITPLKNGQQTQI